MSRRPRRIDEAETRRLAAIVRDASRPEAERRAARDAIVLGNLGLAHAVARKASLPAVIPTDDRISEATLALFRAAEGFDPGQGVAFSSYACRCMVFALVDLGATDRTVRLPKYTTSGRMDRKATLGRARNTAAIRAARGDTVSLSAGAYAADFDLAAPEAEADPLAEALDRLPAAVDRLRPADRELIRARLDGRTFREIAAPLGLTHQAISLRMVKALGRLKAELGAPAA